MARSRAANCRAVILSCLMMFYGTASARTLGGVQPNDLMVSSSTQLKFYTPTGAGMGTVRFDVARKISATTSPDGRYAFVLSSTSRTPSSGSTRVTVVAIAAAPKVLGTLTVPGLAPSQNGGCDPVGMTVTLLGGGSGYNFHIQSSCPFKGAACCKAVYMTQ